MLREWLNYMLRAQKSALEIALERAKKLARIKEWLETGSYSPSIPELEIIYEMGLSNRQYWTGFEAGI